MTCPLEVLKTRLQSSGLALRPVFQVQMGTLSGTGVIRPGTVTPGLLQVLRYVPTAAAFSAVVVLLNRPHRYHPPMHFPLFAPTAAPSCYVRAVVLGAT